MRSHSQPHYLLAATTKQKAVYISFLGSHADKNAISMHS